MTQEQIDLLQTIEFSSNFNQKLQCDAFTTIRPTDNEKYLVGNHYKISLQNKVIAIAMIEDIRGFYLHELNEFIARLETGYSLDFSKRLIQTMYPKIDFNKERLQWLLLIKSAHTLNLQESKDEIKKYNHWYASDY